ncbi:DMT family transporter [Limibacillus halophilus]|uniref:Drug/metabolite transporter (DMT)-like permease n=1 Tax=Limibacillus halophilus TaxID=1579333 RepID=A0A839SX13_9PROT|nr:DMT family transporter [Limibacillus halophilus]MBB3066220.1 drug/metabolite transporter (DMT)-like permease [Limibacillus halophilus]
MQFSSDNARGATYMVACMVGYVLNDAMIKLASADLGLFQTVFLRGGVISLLIGILAWNRGQLLCRLSKQDWRLLGLRIFGELGGTVCFLMALFNMPLANATAIMQAMPLAVTLAAALFLGEAVGWRRYSAILIGFLGVLVIVRPGTEGFTSYSFWAVGALGFLVLRDLTTRRFSEKLPSVFAVLMTSLAATVMGGVASVAVPWNPVTLQSFLLLTAAAVFLLFGYLFSVMAMRVGEIGFVSPFRYTVLIWAIILGYLVFGDVPDGWMLLGSLIVVGMGSYTFYRERQRRAQEGKPDVPPLAGPSAPSTRP